MEDMKAMMQNELRQALAELMLTPAAVIPPVVDAPPANNNNAGGNL